MTVTPEEAIQFHDYVLPLKALEESFKNAGLNIEFEFSVSVYETKRIEIRYKWGNRYVSIEGDSPAQAVKDVAAAVRL